MKFLTKLGGILVKGLEIWSGFSPIINSAAPGNSGIIATISKDFTEVANIIAQVEAIGQTLNLAGPAKLQAATPLVAQVIIQSAMLANHKINDEVLFNQGCKKIADGMADVLNSFHDNIETVSKT